MNFHVASTGDIALTDRLGQNPIGTLPCFAVETVAAVGVAADHRRLSSRTAAAAAAAPTAFVPISPTPSTNQRRPLRDRSIRQNDVGFAHGSLHSSDEQSRYQRNHQRVQTFLARLLRVPAAAPIPPTLSDCPSCKGLDDFEVNHIRVQMIQVMSLAFRCPYQGRTILRNPTKAPPKAPINGIRTKSLAAKFPENWRAMTNKVPSCRAPRNRRACWAATANEEKTPEALDISA